MDYIPQFLQKSVVCGRSDIVYKRMKNCSSYEVPVEVNTQIVLNPIQASQFPTDLGDQEKECVQALQLLKGHDWNQSNICTQVNTQLIFNPIQASQSETGLGDQALRFLEGHDRKPSSISTKASQSQTEVGDQAEECKQVVNFKSKKPKWLGSFLRRTFFHACPKHYTGRNELNQYCIDCDALLCKCCLSMSPSPHAEHRLLKLYRHVYKEVALVEELKRHMNCSRIQPYRCNKQMVLALTPLPHTGGKNKEEARCYTCKRKLYHHQNYSYCSISCKVEAFSKKKNDRDPPFLSIQRPEEPKVSSRRKGIPQRSPFF